MTNSGTETAFNQDHCISKKVRRVHRGGGGGSSLPMNPPRSFKFRLKINGMRAHCVRARFRDRSRPYVFHRMHATFIQLFKDMIVAERARPCSSGRRVTDWLRCLGAVRADHFRCKTVSTASVRKGSMTRRRASTATLFSQQNEKRRVQSHRFSGRLVYGEGISERNPLPRLIDIVVVRRVRKMLGCCGQIARRWHCLGAQVFVFLAKDKGDSLRVTPLADEKKVCSFTACDDVYACRSAAFWTGFERSARVAVKISLMQQISDNRLAAD